VVTGSQGFIGKNLLAALSLQKDIKVYGFDVNADKALLKQALLEADVIYHLAGVNRPEKEEEFVAGNTDSLKNILTLLVEMQRKPAIVLSSSTQALINNPYGQSKKMAEDILFAYGEKTGAQVHIFRLTNVFGKWCRPNYNSVVATFCHNIANNLEITISEQSKEIELVYIDDIVDSFLHILENNNREASSEYRSVSPTYRITLGQLADKIYQFRNMRDSLIIPDLADDFSRRLYATYLSYLSQSDFSYNLKTKIDNRGALTELIKSAHLGQIFVSRTHGKITRGNHYHNTKVEKFCVIQGEAKIKLRHILSEEIIVYKVSGNDLKLVDIPPGYTHSIENLADNEMIVLFWADEIFDPDKPDTYYKEV
jgi:UDP-2-acetamido-2,6-beta-L-arabino-hexul-4-ose reductase